MTSTPLDLQDQPAARYRNEPGAEQAGHRLLLLPDTEGPEKAVNGSVSGGNSDKWCSGATTKFLRVDLGSSYSVNSFVVKHAGAGGENTVWGDSKWAEFCMYDFYLRSGRTADASRVFSELTGNRDNLPPGASNTAYFRDWFYPLWQENGGNAAVLQRFFELLSLYFPTRTENGGVSLVYTRRMNVGELVHFMSGAANKDLSARAATAFNTAWNQAQLTQAKADFPQITY